MDDAPFRNFGGKLALIIIIGALLITNRLGELVIHRHGKDRFMID